METTDKAAVLAVGLGAIFLGAWYLQSRLTNIVTAAPGVAADLVAGVVIGTGDVVGIPRTNETECQRAIREGRSLDASFYCPAGTYISSSVNPFAKSVDYVGGLLSGSSDWSLGTAIYDWTH